MNLINGLESLQPVYLTEYNLTSITPIVKSPSQGRTIGEQFNNLPLTQQAQMMYAILNEEETLLYVMTRARLKRIDTISQTRKSLQA